MKACVLLDVGSAIAHISAWLSSTVAVTQYESELAVVTGAALLGSDELGEGTGGGDAGGVQEFTCGDPGGVDIVDNEARPGYAKF